MSMLNTHLVLILIVLNTKKNGHRYDSRLRLSDLRHLWSFSSKTIDYILSNFINFKYIQC